MDNQKKIELTDDTLENIKIMAPHLTEEQQLEEEDQITDSLVEARKTLNEICANNHQARILSTAAIVLSIAALIIRIVMAL